MRPEPLSQGHEVVVGDPHAPHALDLLGLEMMAEQPLDVGRDGGVAYRQYAADLRQCSRTENLMRHNRGTRIACAGHFHLCT